MEKRQTYGGVIDFKILLDDFRNNNITDRSFKCLDDQFFGSSRPREPTQNDVPKKKESVQMNVEDFGFFQESEDDGK